MSLSHAPSSTAGATGLGAGSATAFDIPLPPDVAARPPIPQPPAGAPFFFNPVQTNDTRVCHFTIQSIDKDEGILNSTEMELARSTGRPCCSGVGIWNDVLIACRTESPNSTETYESCVNTTNLYNYCSPMGGYQANVEWLFWGEVWWPEPFDNSTHLLATAFGARNVAGASNDTADGQPAGNGTSPSPAEACCALVDGTYGPSVASNKQKRFGEYKKNMWPVCLIVKEKEDAYRQCVLATAPNALVMADSWFYPPRPKENWGSPLYPPEPGAAPSRKLGLGFALLAVSSALLASVA